MADDSPSPRDLIVGEFQHDFTLRAAEGEAWESPGGSALYAAVGYLVWDKDPAPGICTRVGEDFPQGWLDDFRRRGLNLDGVVVLPQSLEYRSCQIIESDHLELVVDPIPHYARAGLPLPPGLLGYTPPNTSGMNRRKARDTAVREDELPADYSSATGAHLCPLDYFSHNLLPAVLRRRGFSTITLSPDMSYMDPAFMGDIPGLVTGLTAFMPGEAELKNLFQGSSADLWEIAAELGRYGCELIVIRREGAGIYLYDSASGKKRIISPYPSRIRHPLGGGDAFCGGFLAGFRRSYDPLQAVYYGSVSYSLVVEGSGPFFALNALPGLAEARLDYLQGCCREV
jgi:sugar/nucleoside kinase (ribokinase family)